MAETALVDGISRALGVPHPFVHEENQALVLVEDWRQLARQVVREPILVRPLGYYRSPESVDIYVFECTMGRSDGDKKTWKIYRRYRQFQKYVSNSSELLSSMVVPRLSQTYMKIFYAKQCKDRLVELHAWLTGVIENTQSFYQQQDQQQQSPHNPSSGSANDSHKQEEMPALWLCAFLFAGANSPFPHYFRGLPSFAFALEEVNIQLTKAPIFPSKLRSSIETNAGLGLRLTPRHDQQGKFIGATVSGFLRDASELDASLAKVQIGAKLVRINGVDVTDEAFDKVLSHLRSVGLPLRLRFVYNPHLHRHQRAKSLYLKDSEGSIDVVGSPTQSRLQDPTQGRSRRMSSAASTVSSSSNAQELQFRTRSSVALPTTTPLLSKPPTSGTGSIASARSDTMVQRRYSVDSRKSIGIFSSVFGDLFGRKRNETADVLYANQADDVFSWDDLGGEFRDIISRGFFSFLSQSLLHELRQKERLQYDESELKQVSTSSSNNSSETDKALKALNERKGQGVWTTSTGPMGFSFGACKLRDVEAAMLEIPPVFFSSRLGFLGSEKHLGKGFVLVSINNESTFGMKFSAVMRMLTKASRPTSVCFRWYKDYSPFLETDLAEHEPESTSQSRRGSGTGIPLKSDLSKAFEHGLECLSEAQSDLCSNLHLALVENASIRNEIGVLQDAQRESQMKRDRAEQAEASMQAQFAKLKLELATRDADLRSAREKWQVSDALLASSKQEYHKMLETVHVSAKQMVVEHEERLVRESNKSIETARVISERKSKKELEAALDELQRSHEEYLQKLAEEHSEEVESLMQQVVVWRHQVEVLTEAEKRNYAAMVNNGVNPYQDYGRSRFGFADSPFSSLGGGGGGNGTRGASVATGRFSERSIHNKNDSQSQQHVEYESWRDGTPEDPSDHTFSDLADRASLSSGTKSYNTTLWGRMVSLITD